MARGSGGQSIKATIITFLSRFDSGVSASGTQEAAGGGVAAVGKIGVMEPRFTDFIEGLLNDAVTTGAAFEETGGRAAVTVSAVTVVAFLRGGEDPVPTGRSSKNLRGKGAGERAEVARGVALLGSYGDAIATGCGAEGGLKTAGSATAIPSPSVTVITGFRGSEDAITAEGDGSNEGFFAQTGGGTAVCRADVAVVAGFTGVCDGVTANGEGAGGAAAVGGRVRVLGALVALFSGIDLGVTTGGETVCVLGAGVGAGGGDDDATVDGTFGMGRGAATKVGVAFVGAGSGDGGAGVAQTSEMGGAGVTAEEGIAGVGAASGEGDTGSVLAFGMLSAVDDAVTGIGTGALESDTCFVLANGVGFCATTDNGITLIGALSNDGDAGITLAFGVFVAVDAGGALIGTGAVLIETGVRCGTNEVAGTGAVRIGGTGIGAGALEGNAGVVFAGGVGDSAAALGWFTETGTRAGEENADGSLAFGMLEAAYFGGAGIGTRAGDGDALILGVAFVVELSATAEDGVTLVCSGT